MVFPLEVVIGQTHSQNNSGKDCGRTQLQLKSLRIENHTAFVNLQWRSKWLTDSSSAKQRGQALTTIMFWRRRLSIVRILFRRASHAKARTVGGALIPQREDQLPEWAGADDKKEKEDTEKVLSCEGAQILLSCPSLEMSIPIRTSKRLKRWASSALERFLLKIGHHRLLCCILGKEILCQDNCLYFP